MRKTTVPRSTLILAATFALAIPGATATAAGPHVAHHGPHGGRPPAAELPLGRAGLTETRTRQTLQPGVTLTTIVRGEVDGTETWTVELVVPAGATDPDPDAPPSALRDEGSAELLAAQLVAEGFDARAEQVNTPDLADYAPGELGWRVRDGAFTTQAAADAEKAALAAAGHSGSTVYTGYDGDDPDDAGPWVIRTLTIDPKRFRGRLDATFGPDLEQRDLTSTLATAAGATAAVNAGYFVFDPANGAPGDPAGVGVYQGRLLSETIGDRPALRISDNARHTAVERLTFAGSVSGRGVRLPLDGIDRVAGKIRNCGGLDDVPTDLPQHDFTCTDDDELILMTPEFGASTPSGPGTEVVLGKQGKVLAVHQQRGLALAPSTRSLQATGDLADDLLALAAGGRIKVAVGLEDARGRKVTSSPRESIVNGGPELVRNGHVDVTARRDGLVREHDPSWFYGFAHKRNPRTFAGIDAHGRTILVTADGRSVGSVGLSMAETGSVAQALGMVDAMNLDGGGSTTMVVDGQVINDPSDAAGERAVGDALLVMPGRGRH